MLLKTPKRSINYLKYIVVAELLFLGGTFAFYTAINRNRDYRLYLYKNCNPLLDAYYSIGETLDSTYKGREVDLDIWVKSKKI